MSESIEARSDGGGGGEGGAGSQRRKTKTPHGDVGNKNRNPKVFFMCLFFWSKCIQHRGSHIYLGNVISKLIDMTYV